MLEAGCYVDGSAIKTLDFDLAVIDLGVSLGFEGSNESDLRVIEAARNGAEIQISGMDVDVEGYIREVADEVVEWLDMNRVADGWTWHVEEQSLFYGEISDDVWM
jgi:hypothetical protein